MKPADDSGTAEPLTTLENGTVQQRYVNPYSLSASITLPQTQIIASDLAHQPGDDVEARRLYEDLLLHQWKNADADFPVLVQVKNRIAKLGK